MAFDKNMLTFISDGPNEALTLTILGSLKSLHQPRHGVHAARPQPPRLTVDREVPTRDPQCLTRFSRNVDIRCMQSLRSFRDRLKTDYSCDARYCPMLKARLEQHRQRCARRPQEAAAVAVDAGGPSLADRSAQNSLKITNRASSPISGSHDFSTPSADKQLLQLMNSSEHTAPDNSDQIQANDVPSTSIEAPDMSSRRSSLSRRQIRKEVEEWLRDVPIFPHLREDEKRQNAIEIENLIKNLNELALATGDLEQEKNIKKEIEKCMKNLPLWHTGSRKDLYAFKDRLVQNLVTKIMNIVSNKQSKSISSSTGSHATSVNIANMYDSKTSINNYGLKDIVIEWLWSINMKTKNYNGMANNMNKIANLVLQHISPIIENPMNRKRQKALLKTTILNVLNDLPIYMNPRITDTHFQRFADDLVDRLDIFQVAYESNTKDAYVEVSPVLSNKSCSIHDDFLEPVHNGGTSIIYEEVYKCFKDANIKCNQDVMKEMELILEELVDTPSDIGENEARIELAHLMILFLNVPETKAFYLAQKIIKRIKAVHDTTVNYNPRTLSQTQTTFPILTRNISVYTTEENFPLVTYPHILTPRRKPYDDSSNKNKCNSHEIEYKNKVAQVIRAWIHTLPQNFSTFEKQHFNDNIIQDLASDITDQNKIAHLTLSNREDKNKYLKYIVCRWVHSIKEFNIKVIIPEIDKLLTELDSISPVILTGRHFENTLIVANVSHTKDKLSKSNKKNRKQLVQDDTVKVFIDKFIKHKYDANDSTARNAANRLLESDLEHLTLSRANVVNNSNTSELGGFLSDQVIRELEYIKDISDWLKNIPLDLAYNTPDNRERIELVIDLAAKIREIEERRETDPNAVVYNEQLANTILQFMNKLPITINKANSGNVKLTDQLLLRDQLLSKIIVHRQDVENKIFINESITTKLNNTTGINTDNIGDFLEEFIRIHGDDIADNELKLEVWALRLIMEIKQIISKSSNQSIVPKAEIYSNLLNVPQPGDETANLFEQAQQKELLSNESSSQTTNIETELPHKVKNMNGADDIIEIIDKWSESLPFHVEDEETTKAMKGNISVKLYQKVGELNMDPKVYNNDVIYKKLLLNEVDAMLKYISEKGQLQGNMDILKTELVESIIKYKNIIKEKTAGDSYKHKLENMIVISMPDPIQGDSAYDPGFEIYKYRLASMFIMDNFDYSYDEMKIKYQKNIKKEIDKYFPYAQKKNSVPLSQDDIYNELYSSLFKVPIPNEASVIDEVEEIKTRCEVDAWFEKLPFSKTKNVSESLKRDEILAALSKRIHEIEKTEQKPDDKITKEILKYLIKLPLGPENSEIMDTFADELLNALKNTKAQRKCTRTSVEPGKGEGKSKRKSGENQESTELYRSPKKTADMIPEIVKAWCNEIPLNVDQDRADTVRDGLVTKIMMKICELNADPATLGVDALFNKLLDDELELLLSTTETPSDFYKIKGERKQNLIQSIESLKPLIREEIVHQRYADSLDKTVDKVLKKPNELPTKKQAQYTELKNNILEELILYKFDDHDDEEKQLLKKMAVEDVHEIVAKIFKYEGIQNDSLLKTNQLFCELSKIPHHQIDFRGEIQEIRMKNEVGDFFKELPIYESVDKTRINHLKTNLAKKLNEIEKDGHSEQNQNKMQKEILKCLQKINTDVSPQTIENFISKLRNNESIRRSFKPRTSVNGTHKNAASGPNTQSLLNRGTHTYGRKKNLKRYVDQEEYYAVEGSRSCSANIQTDRHSTDRRRCHCRGSRGRPYCMVTMMPWCDGGSRVYDMGWCRKSLRGGYF